MKTINEKTAFGIGCAAVLLPRVASLSRPMWIDEGPILVNIATFLGERTLMPPHFSYPPLFSYLATVGAGVGAVVGGVTSGLGPREWAVVESGSGAGGLLLGPRLVAVLLSLLAFLILWWGTRGIAVGWRLAAAFVLAFSPEAIRYGAMALPDVGSMAFALLAVLLAWRYHREAKAPQRTRLLVFSGAALGAAAAFKYNGALALPSLVLAAMLCGDARRGLRDLVLAGLVSLAVFLLLAPTWLLATTEALNGFLFESRNVRTARIGVPPLAFPMLSLRLAALEPGWLLSLLAAIAAAVILRDRGLAILATPLALNFLVLSTWGKQDANYLLPTFGIAALALAHGGEMLGRHRGLSRWAAPVVIGIAVVACLLHQPFPPWAERRAADYLRRAATGDAIVVRVGLNTPKVWDNTARQEFLSGQGAALSPEALRQWEERIREQPHAAEVRAHAREEFLAEEQAARAELFVVVTDAYQRRILNADPAELANAPQAEQRSAALLRDIHDTGQWAQTRHRGGEGWSLIIYHRSPEKQHAEDQ